MNKLKYFFIVILLFLFGCTAEYNLEIDNDTVKEQFTSIIYKKEIPEYKPRKDPETPERDDRLTPFIEEDQFPFFNNQDIVYQKSIKEEDEYRLVNFKYTFTKEDYSNSRVLNSCFENKSYKYKDNYIINLSGEFYCLHSSELNINVKTNNKVISHNADNKEGNIYTWYINKQNVLNVNIQMEIERNSTIKTISNYTIPIVILFIVIVILCSFVFIKIKRKNHNQI